MNKFNLSLDKPIKNIFENNYYTDNISEKDRLASPMPEWYNKLLDKSYSELTLFDVTRMLMQNIYTDIALQKAKEFLTENPLCGEYYDCHLLEVISRLDALYLEKDRIFYENLITKAYEEIEKYNFESTEEKQAALRIINKIKIKISGE